ncbi:ral GTPase-activating protein subunit beta isoform X3 [Atheta coriaria]|uniref:ral GTPase-activating protein subunit beta isoform X3 n=1 Tax=Dalotia coriaria TaxID=877792 RepID=UPI0031F44A3B
MNLGLFNRVNLKDTPGNKGMYSEWTSLSQQVQNFGDAGHSVLEKFGIAPSKEVTSQIVKQLASNLGHTQVPEPSLLVTDHEVQWCMDVICYGLSLPLTEHDAIKDCANIYCEWLSALLPAEPRVCVPKPVVDDPNVYARKIIQHFHYLFIPRKGEGIDIINRQAVVCHRVLRTLQLIAQESKVLERSTWESLLLFLLAINDTLLAPPTVKDDVADQLCERILSVLFEIWLLACVHNFPSPPLWKTLRESCMNWRHRIALVEQWNRVNLALTSKLLSFMYGPTFPELKIGEDDLIPSGMTDDCIAQSWYRFLNTIGNPVQLTKPDVISQTQKFMQFALGSPGPSVADPCQHPSLQSLPLIFLKAMKGIAGQVDAFLGIAQPISWEAMVMGGGPDKAKDGGAQGGATPSPTPPTQRRLAKSFSVAPSSTSKGAPRISLMGVTSSRATASIPSSVSSSGPSSTSSLPSLSSIGSENRIPLAPDRPKCNSILHLFGEWLFQAAFIGTELTQRQSTSDKRPSSIVMEQKTSVSSMGSINDPEIPANLTIDKYESGRAEALGTLCRIMCSKKTGEEILPVYLARFYLAVQQGLKVAAQHKDCGETVIAILMNSSDLFRLDLDGVRILIPDYINALEIVLPDKNMKFATNVAKNELRKASIHLLLSMLVLPLHFQNITIKELISTGSTDRPTTFGQLKPRLMNLVMNALQVENDPQNTHMLLGGLFLCVQDASVYEKVEQVTQPSSEQTTNLLSSVSDTSSTISSSYSDSFISPDLSDIQTPDSAHGLFVRATYLVCHRLISSWKSDLNISLAALELLSGLARIHIKDSDGKIKDACVRAVKWICDYIVQQCSRPPQAHSKDLHSTIVAAFQCCLVWLLEHPYLLHDKECLTRVLEVSELGVSGTKSVGKPGEKIKMKEDKELKPVSMRVRDAAENLLTCILEQVGYFPSECGPESISSLLDEALLLQHCNSWPSGCTNQEKAVERFRYFISDNVMLALLEEPLGNDQDPQPTVTVLIRGPFGRHAWTMQLRHLPRHKSGTKYHAPTMGRPVVMQDAPVRHTVRQKYFPDSVDRVQQCKVDQSIPTLESVFAGNEKANDETNKLAQLIGKQAGCEVEMEAQVEQSECSPPSVVHEFQTARLFLSHFGLLNLDNDPDGNGPSLIAIDSSSSEFCKDLSSLDAMSPRTCDTVHVFYVKSQQTNVQDILANALVDNAHAQSPYFTEFLKSLGWVVNVAVHPGWTGHVSTSWVISNAESVPATGVYDGQSQVLYWADACSEIAFVMPSMLKPFVDAETQYQSASLSSWYERSLSEQSGREKRTLSLDLDKQSVPVRRLTQRSSVHPPTNTKIMIVWLESYEDHLKVPIDDLLNSMHTGLETAPTRPSDVLVIYLHLMTSGLFRVHLQGPCGRVGMASPLVDSTNPNTGLFRGQGPTGRVGLASPLIDGMIVSRRALGPLVRQTTLNMSRRRRLDSDSYQPPHVRRRFKIQDIVQKYKREMTPPELLTYLFSNP